MDHNSFPLFDAENQIRVQDIVKPDGTQRVVIYQRGVRIGAAVKISGGWGSTIRARKVYPHLEWLIQDLPSYTGERWEPAPMPGPEMVIWSEWWDEKLDIRLTFCTPDRSKPRRLAIMRNGVMVQELIFTTRKYGSGWYPAERPGLRLVDVDTAVRRACGLPQPLLEAKHGRTRSGGKKKATYVWV